jgi:hypothetical protein
MVSDETVRIDAEAIDVTLSPRRMAAKGNVRSVLQPARAKPGAAAARRPGLLGETEPVNIIAAEMTYDEQARKGVYTGGARLWQGNTTIQSDAITLDEARGDLSASGSVVTALSLASDQPTSTAKAPPTIVRASMFRYADDIRQGGDDTEAQMTGEQASPRRPHRAASAADENRPIAWMPAAPCRWRFDTQRSARLTYRPADQRTRSPARRAASWTSATTLPAAL